MKEMWGRWNINSIESKSGHMSKLRLKVNKRKLEVQKWKNSANDMIDKNLRRKHTNISSVICPIV